MESLILYKSPYDKTRVGRNCDGGYVICLLPEISCDGKPEPYDLIISGGISDDISFEEAFIGRFCNTTGNQTKCLAFDGTISQMPATVFTDKILFHRRNLGNYESEEKNLTNLVKYMDGYSNIFMKIDIEGHEFRLFPELVKHNQMCKIKQLVLEIHTPADIQLFPDYFAGLSDIDNTFMFALLNDINKTHTLVHFHGNNGCKTQVIDGIKVPHVFECTYIRNDYFEGKEKEKNTETLPSHLDRCNVRHMPDFAIDYYPFCCK